MNYCMYLKLSRTYIFPFLSLRVCFWKRGIFFDEVSIYMGYFIILSSLRGSLSLFSFPSFLQICFTALIYQSGHKHVQMIYFHFTKCGPPSPYGERRVTLFSMNLVCQSLTHDFFFFPHLSTGFLNLKWLIASSVFTPWRTSCNKHLFFSCLTSLFLDVFIVSFAKKISTRPRFLDTSRVFRLDSICIWIWFCKAGLFFFFCSAPGSGRMEKRRTS